MNLMECLCHDERDGPYQPSALQTVTAYLYQIINARAPVWRGLTQPAPAGIPSFGLSHLLRSQGKFHLTAVAQEIETLIRRYEPRLTQVRVQHLPHAFEQHQVQLAISGRLIAAEGGSALRLLACLDFNAGLLTRLEDADA